MIELSIYGYKRYKRHQQKKKLREAAAEAPPIVDQSSEFGPSPTSSHAIQPAEGGSVGYAASYSTGCSGTVSEPNSAVEPISALDKRWQEYSPSPTLSSPSSEYKAYQQYVERQSNSVVNVGVDQPPTYQAALSPPPEQPRGQWIFVPTSGQIPFANGAPLNPPLPAISPVANELPASLPPAAYAKSIPNELPADVPMGIAGNPALTMQRKTSQFQLAAAENLSGSRESRPSDSETGSRKSGETQRYELA